jgi:hypothetical protein
VSASIGKTIADEVPVAERPSAKIDTTVPSVARMWDYFLGGKDNFAVDRAAAEDVLAVSPETVVTVRSNRAFLARAVAELARSGVDQFIDVGAGLPTVPNTHEIARSVLPEARVVYVDNDPIVLAHSQAFRAPSGVITVGGDLRSPERIIDAPAVRELIDFTRPVGCIFGAIFHFIPPEDQPLKLISAFAEALPTGSAMVITHISDDLQDPHVVDRIREIYAASVYPAVFRKREEIAELFTGLTMMEPGLVLLSEWRPDTGHTPEARWYYGGVGVKP